MLAATCVSAIVSGSLLMLPKFQPAPREFRAVWVATVDNIDWPSKKTLSTQQQQDELTHIFDVAQEAGLNAIVFQVRPSCDTLYPSSLEPWSEFLTGRQGRPPEPNWDPLEFAIDAAHSRGMELHAWFNPYRAKHFKATGPLSQAHVSYTKPNVTKSYGRYLWLDPGEPDVQAHSKEVMLEVVRKYAVDGIHIDDYFYPYEEKDASGNGIRFPDEGSYARYRKSGGTMSLAHWRRNNVDTFIESLYRELKLIKKEVKFGISPFGIARPNQPEGVKAGIDQFDHPLYADCRKWLAEGWCDYFTPQLYWKIDSPGQPYEPLLKWWVKQNTRGRHMWPGNFTSRLMANEGNWPIDEIENQILKTRKTAGATGNIHFSMKAFLTNAKGLVGKLSEKHYKNRALVPSSPWLGMEPPPSPKAKLQYQPGDAALKWEQPVGAPVKQWAIYASDGVVWRLIDVVGGSAQEFVWAIAPTTKGVALTAISSSGVESAPRILTVN